MHAWFDAQSPAAEQPAGPDLFWQVMLKPVSQYWLAAQLPSYVQPNAQMPLKQNSPEGQGLLVLQSAPGPPPLGPPPLPVEVVLEQPTKRASVSPLAIQAL